MKKMRPEERIEERIEQAANKYVGHPYEPDESNTITATRKAFIDGAKWADKHPKRYSQGELCDIQEEMMKQREKRLLEKACEWLENRHNIVKSLGILTSRTEDLSKAFRQAMGE